MRISRPCYDKYHRCPGWAGGGLRFGKTDRCESGYVTFGEKKLWKWRTHRCNKCDVVVLPSHVRWLDLTWWNFKAIYWWRSWRTS